MFKTESVPVYLQKVTLGADGDKRTAKCLLYITPVTAELAAEADPKIAEDLFRKNGSGFDPKLEVTRASFDVRIPAQDLEFYHDADPEVRRITGALIEDVKISGIHALRLYPDKPDFTLAFDATFEVADKAVASRLVIDLLKRKFMVTMTEREDPQGPLFVPDGEANQCSVCSAEATWSCDSGSRYCDEHISGAKGETGARKIERGASGS